MYNPRCRPFVPHVRGTELIIEHIEKYVCPTITSVDLLGGKANRFAEDNRPHVAFLVSDDHYHADKTLPAFAQMLRERFGCHCTVMHGQGTCDIPATSELEGVDCLVVYVRRLALPKEQLDRVRKYADSGKPLVGLRTASHAFSLLGKIEAGQAEWPEFDAQVLGGNYHGHAGNKLGTDVAIVAEQSAHPLLAGVEPTRWHSTSSLYFTSPVAANSTVVMTGATGDRTEPLTWTRTHRGGRVVYLGLGDPDDFKVPQFRRLLVNAIFWAMDRPCRWSLFNGENLDGWVIECRPQDNDKRGYWKVEKGTITAETAPGGKHHYIWLLTEKEYGDFELRAKVQTYSTSTGNSGIQVRSRYDKEAGWLDGPQVDINPPGPWRCGFIYDETRGAQVWLWPDVGRPANAKPEHAPPGWKWRHADKEDVWNDVHIACQGKRIKTVINGVTVADYDGTGRLDDEAHRVRNVGLKGHIGLQIHPGNELLIRFKDIELRELE
jgi:type 1 glutamine amidotransferase